MKRSNRLILLIGFFLAAVAFVGIVLLLGGNKPGTGGTGTEATKTTMVVAAVDIPLGTVLKAEMLTEVDVAVADKPVGSYKLKGELIDKTLTNTISKDHILTAADFATSTTNPDIGRLLDPGTRAISVMVDQVSGVGTLVKPGDRVDVVLAVTETDNKNPITVEKAPTREGDPEVTVRNYATIDSLLNNTSVKVLVENLRVVGTLLPPPATANTQNQNQQGTTTTQAPTLNGQSQIVLLEVTPQQAELIRFTQIDGNLSLVLRSPGDAEAEPVTTSGITLRRLVDQYGVLPPKIILTEQP